MLKQIPANARQHVTAGPYAPVLIIRPRELVVISGQVAVDLDGNYIGETFEEEAHKVMQNCLTQLQTASCDFSNVFKVNAYLKDLAAWDRFNVIYSGYMTEPYPVRTAIQAQLITPFQVEIEMWALRGD